MLHRDRLHDSASFNALKARASRTIIVPPHVDNLLALDSRLPAGPPQRLTIFVFDPTVQARMPDNWWPSCTQCGASLFRPGNRL